MLGIINDAAAADDDGDGGDQNENVLLSLQAKTRVKLSFLDHLAKFWELQVSASSS